MSLPRVSPQKTLTPHRNPRPSRAQGTQQESFVGAGNTNPRSDSQTGTRGGKDSHVKHNVRRHWQKLRNLLAFQADLQGREARVVAQHQ